MAKQLVKISENVLRFIDEPDETDQYIDTVVDYVNGANQNINDVLRALARLVLEKYNVVP